uniref:Fibronectin type-III domain-containing protein n=1 Tax=Monopterus albus TaxID=43700 RepID=A0A3Q3K8R9_MONAL
MASVGGFSHFHIVVTDSGWLLEPQEFTVPGNQSHLDIWGLITGIGYEVRLTGVSESGLLSRPLTAVAVTGTTHSALKAPICFFLPPKYEEAHLLVSIFYLCFPVAHRCVCTLTQIMCHINGYLLTLICFHVGLWIRPNYNPVSGKH